MKKSILLVFTALFVSLNLNAQVPNTFNYQAVLRDASGGILPNQHVEIGLSILQGSSSGTVIFAETHTTTTNNFGLANLQIGSVNAADFASIDWSNGPFFIEVSVDGSALGTSQLQSVPFALHAGSVENDQVDDADADPTNELQQLTLENNQLSISGGNSVDLSALQGETGSDNQQLSLGSNNQLSISNGNSVTLPYLIASDVKDSILANQSNITITEAQISNLNHFTNADETDPVYVASQAANITAGNISNLSNLSGINTGDQDLSTLLAKADVKDSILANQSNITITEAQISDLNHFTNADETDPVYAASQAANITAGNISNLSNLSGINTGDQDLSALLAKADVKDSILANQGNITITEAQISDLNHFTNADETDPVYAASQAANITAGDISKLSNLSGINTGDQDLSALLAKADVKDSILANQGNITITEAQISDLN
ncbi:hypothetical protein, partial [Sunxiuqinia rutila]|uniref:hypothetical protein n=1 Tax=Sunxiuqinia rutila TaxID=1397841 RepID=UPI003D362BB7